jgi:hypothetical protein
MNARLLLFLMTGVMLTVTGCFTSQGPGQERLPADWVAALPKAGSPHGEITGVFGEVGEQFAEQSRRAGQAKGTNLSRILTPRLLAAGPAESPHREATTEVRQIDEGHLELITRIAGVISERVVVEAEFEKSTGVVVLHHGRSTGHLAATGRLAATVRLWRAPDGRLYAHVTGHFIGEMMLVPIVSSTEMWCRWTPEPLAAATK